MRAYRSSTYCIAYGATKCLKLQSYADKRPSPTDFLVRIASAAFLAVTSSHGSAIHLFPLPLKVASLTSSSVATRTTTYTIIIGEQTSVPAPVSMLGASSAVTVWTDRGQQIH